MPTSTPCRICHCRQQAGARRSMANFAFALTVVGRGGSVSDGRVPLGQSRVDGGLLHVVLGYKEFSRE